ncbi:MAG: hypothetical protein ACXVBH_06175, partial [Flavisolibacter sp.]
MMTMKIQMNKRCFYKTFLILALMPFVSEGLFAQVSFKTKEFQLSFDNTGKMTEMRNLLSKTNYLYSGEASYLLSLKRNGVLLEPTGLQWKNKSSEIVLSYTDKSTATVKANSNERYISFDLKQLSNAAGIDLVIWGPYATTIGDTIGEVVGVVRNKEFAIGIQALNVKALGGYPGSDSDIQPSYDVFTDGNKVDVLKDDLNKQLYRGDVARGRPYGSSLQAYCRNRDKDRVIENWGHTRYLAPSYKEDGGVIGSKLAIFGVTTSQVLNTISAIELKENLPHPLLDGIWGKQSPKASESYLIMSFSESSLQEAIDFTKQGGLRYLYHEGPFETWGHFTLNKKDFPNNWQSLKACVDKAKTQGVRLGLHTLSNFITTNDP